MNPPGETLISMASRGCKCRHSMRVNVMPSKSLTIHSNRSGSSTLSTETNKILHIFGEFLMLDKVRPKTDTGICYFF